MIAIFLCVERRSFYTIECLSDRFRESKFFVKSSLPAWRPIVIILIFINRIKIISSVAFTLNTLLSKRIKLNLYDPYVYKQYLKYQTEWALVIQNGFEDKYVARTQLDKIHWKTFPRIKHSIPIFIHYSLSTVALQFSWRKQREKIWITMVLI